MSEYEHIYDRGRVTWFASEEDGGPDVGIAIGLGDSMALYAGDLPNPNSYGLKLYSENPDFPSEVIADDADPEACRRLIDALTVALNAFVSVPRTVVTPDDAQNAVHVAKQATGDLPVVVTLAPEDFDEFLRHCENPAPPNEALRKLVQQVRAVKQSTGQE